MCFLGVGTVFALCASANADVALTNVGTTAAALAGWSTTPGTPIYTSIATPVTAATSQGNVGVSHRLDLPSDG